METPPGEKHHDSEQGYKEEHNRDADNNGFSNSAHELKRLPDNVRAVFQQPDGAVRTATASELCSLGQVQTKRRKSGK